MPADEDAAAEQFLVGTAAAECFRKAGVVRHGHRCQTHRQALPSTRCTRTTLCAACAVPRGVGARRISESIARRRRGSRAAFLIEVVRQHALGALGARSQAVQGAGSLRTSRCTQIPVKWNMAYCTPLGLPAGRMSHTRLAAEPPTLRS